MDFGFADRVDNLQPEGAYRVMALANELERKGRDIVHLEIGQPDFPTFPAICEAGKQAIDDGFTRYNPSEGYPDIRETIARYSRSRELEVDPSEVVVGPGAKPGLIFPLLALLDRGDEVLYPDPGFPTYRAAIELTGATPVPIPLIEDNSFSFDLNALRDRVSEKTKLCILNSPANPTGGVIPPEDLQEIANLCIERNIWALSDEIYSRLVYDEMQAKSIAALDGMRERTIIVDGFSKSYAMTGWRLGYSIMPRPLAEKVGLLLMHSVGCTAGFTQKAGVVAIEQSDSEVERVVAEYQIRRNLIVNGLNEIDGISCRSPEGAFYAFPNVSRLGIDSSALADRLLDEAGVACLSGTDFGDSGEGYLRFSYATSRMNIDKALRRVGDFISKLSS